MTTPSNSRATASARPDLPLAVGPATTNTGAGAPPARLPPDAPAAASDRSEWDSFMPSILTLVTDPSTPGLSDGLVADVTDALADASGTPAAPDWLAERVACDIPFDGVAPAAAADAARRALGDAPVDLLAQPAAGRRKALLAADMESTIIRNEILDDLAAIAGIGDAIAAITRRAMAGEFDFADAVRERVALLTGMTTEVLERAYRGIAYTPGAATLVRTMRAAGAHTMLVSGGFRYFTVRVRDALGFAEDVGNVLQLADGKLTGEVRDPVLTADGKLEAMERAMKQHGLTADRALAVGDGANDVAMLRTAGLGIAYRGKDALAAVADATVAHGDLTALLYFQGYRQAEFVE